MTASSDDDDESTDVLFQRAPASLNASLPTAPPDNLLVQEGAILDCFQASMDQRKWKAPPLFRETLNMQKEHSKNNPEECPPQRSLADWKPAELQLPQWAIDMTEGS